MKPSGSGIFLQASRHFFFAQKRCGAGTGANINISSWFAGSRSVEYVTAVS
jgi:hypothetical protein